MLKELFYKKAFDRIFLDHYDRLYRYACHLTGDPETSRDIVGDVFTRLWEDMSKVDTRRVDAYLTVSVRNRCTDHLRHLIVQTEYADEYLAATDELYTNDSEARRQDALVALMLEKLPPLTRQVLEACYLKQKKYSEVADELGISPHTVKKHISKSLKLLKEAFANQKTLPEIPDFDN